MPGLHCPDCVLLNGSVVRKDSTDGWFSARAGRYGDAVFETLRVAGGRVLWAPQHAARLALGTRLLHLQGWGFLPNEAALQEQASLLLAALPKAPAWRLRLQVARMGEGRYLPSEDGAGYVLEAEALAEPAYAPQAALAVRALPHWPVPSGPLAQVKTASAAVWVGAALQAQQAGANDALLPDAWGRPVCLGSGNLWVLHGSVLSTPPLGTGAVAGVLRAVLLQLGHVHGCSIAERSLDWTDVKQAQAVFRSNVILGLQPVKRISWQDECWDFEPADNFCKESALVLNALAGIANP